MFSAATVDIGCYNGAGEIGYKRGKEAGRRTDLHGDVALLDGEELKGGEGRLAGLREAVHLHGQVVALRVPEQAHICTPQQDQLPVSGHLF